MFYLLVMRGSRGSPPLSVRVARCRVGGGAPPPPQTRSWPQQRVSSYDFYHQKQRSTSLVSLVTPTGTNMSIKAGGDAAVSVGRSFKV